MAFAQELRFFRIGAGLPGESHFPMAGIIANIISNPPGARPCERGGSCGVPGLVAVAQSTGGGTANVEAVDSGRLEAGLVTADIAYWAATGSGPFRGKPAAQSLRAVSTLSADALHLVVRRESGITSVKDLRGKRVSLGERGSATQLDAGLVLDAYGLKPSDLKDAALRPAQAADALAKGTLDAFFLLDGAPVPVIEDLARSTAIALVPIEGAPAARLREKYPFFGSGTVPGDLYEGIEESTPTLQVEVLLLTNAQQPPALVEGITRALWQPSSRRLLTQGKATIRLGSVLPGIGLPMHQGALSYYEEAKRVE